MVDRVQQEALEKKWFLSLLVLVWKLLKHLSEGKWANSSWSGWEESLTMLFPLYVCNEWNWRAYDVLGRLHHLLLWLAVHDSTVPVPNLCRTLSILQRFTRTAVEVEEEEALASPIDRAEGVGGSRAGTLELWIPKNMKLESCSTGSCMSLCTPLTLFIYHEGYRDAEEQDIN